MPWDDDDDRCTGCGAGYGEACEEWCGLPVELEEVDNGFALRG